MTESRASHVVAYRYSECNRGSCYWRRLCVRRGILATTPCSSGRMAQPVSTDATQSQEQDGETIDIRMSHQQQNYAEIVTRSMRVVGRQTERRGDKARR